MGTITVVGLGPGARKYLTCEAWETLLTAGEVWLRTAHHPIVAELPASLVLHAFDELYERAETFEEVYAAIVARLLELGQRAEGVVYAVPGHPRVGEATVSRLVQASREAGVPLRLVDGLSFVEPVLSALELDALDGLQIVDALELVSLHHPPLNPDFPALIAQVYSRAVASDLKLVLMNQYPDEHQVALVHAVGTASPAVVWLPLYEMDRQEVTALTTLYVAPLPPVSSFEGFQETIARLRAPGGCPWDRAQTHQSLRNNLLEEAYEVLAAIDAEDMQALREELGDLLLQIVLHAQIATEEGTFRMADVIGGIDAKIKRRHPHVWGARHVRDVKEVCANWEALKRQEREARGETQRSALDGVPKALPALAQAHAYGGRASRLGLELSAETTLTRVQQLLRELEGDPDERARYEGIGALLQMVANYARLLGVDPESALRDANRRFAARFRQLEAEARRRAVTLETLASEGGVEKLWQV